MVSSFNTQTRSHVAWFSGRCWSPTRKNIFSIMAGIQVTPSVVTFYSFVSFDPCGEFTI